MKSNLIQYMLLFVILLIAGCSKKDDPTPTPPVTPPVVPTTPQTCIISGVSQRNSGTKAEFAINVTYNTALNPTAISVYDSAGGQAIYNTTLTYATADSIRLNANEYFKLDASKRVIVFVTNSDMINPSDGDNYRYEYVYNTEGYLITKYLYINGSRVPNYTTSYTYTGTVLTGCTMLATSSGNLKILESTLSYESTLAPKTLVYTFPDGFESFYFTAALNFGTKPTKLLSKVVTNLFNPATNAILDTWTTNYSGYTLDANGYLSTGTATGDLQQGMASFYGKTYFMYQCQ